DHARRRGSPRTGRREQSLSLDRARGGPGGVAGGRYAHPDLPELPGHRARRQVTRARDWIAAGNLARPRHRLGGRRLAVRGSPRKRTHHGRADRRANAPAARPRARALEHLPGIQQPLRVERVLEAAHELELERMLVPPDLLAFELAEAVLGGDRAAEALERVVHRAVHLFAAGHQRFGADVVVEVAVAHVAEAVDVDIAEALAQAAAGAVDEFRDLRHRQRDIVLHVRELSFRDGLADAPQVARLLA